MLTRLSFLVLVMLAAAVPASAQGVVRLALTGVPPILASPFLSDLEAAYRQGRYPLQLVYTEPTGRATSLRFQVELEWNGQPVLDVTSLPTTFNPGVSTLRTFADPFGVAFPGGYTGTVQRLRSDVREQVQQAGRLPDGRYQLTITPLVGVDGQLGVTLPAIAFFEVQTAEPPILLSPSDGDLLSATLPLFSWTPAQRVPAGVAVEYVLTIAELQPGQTPLQALRAGTPYFRQALLGLTTFPYTRAQVPFEGGRTYVWQVRVQDPLRRLTFLDDGETEIYTFRTPATAQGQAITWRYPLAAPVMEFAIADAEQRPGGLFVSGSYQGTVDGVPQTATFHGVLLDPVTLAIRSGEVRIGGRPLESVIR